MADRNDWSHSVTNRHNSSEERRTAKVSGIARVRDVTEVNIGRKSEWDRLNCPHPATFPPALAEWCGKLICPPGGTILDPFNGSASTGVAAIRNGWDYIGIDAVQEYIDMSEQRLLHVTQEMEQGAA